MSGEQLPQRPSSTTGPSCTVSTQLQWAGSRSGQWARSGQPQWARSQVHHHSHVVGQDLAHSEHAHAVRTQLRPELAVLLLCNVNVDLRAWGARSPDGGGHGGMGAWPGVAALWCVAQNASAPLPTCSAHVPSTCQAPAQLPAPTQAPLPPSPVPPLHARNHAQARTHARKHARTHARTHAYTRTHTHAHTHTHARTGRSYSDPRGCRPPIMSEECSGSHTITTSASSSSCSCACMGASTDQAAFQWHGAPPRGRAHATNG